jgi:hypothetical protein
MPKNPPSIFSCVALLTFVLSLCSCSPRPFDADAEGAKLLKIDAEWADLATDGKDVTMPRLCFPASLLSKAKPRYAPT